MPVIKIGDRLVGDGQPTYIIAEIGVNHNGFLDLALKLINVAVEAGADAVKFQKRNLHKLYAKKYLENANSGEKTLRYLLPILQRVELGNDDYYVIQEHCQKQGITFLCSAFDSDSADFLETLGIPAYKVASADLTNLPLLDHLIAKGKPLILSTGMCHMHEVELTVEFLKERQAEFALLHCNSTYPAAFEDINLRFMDKLRRFGVPVGYSGHERGIAVSTVASALGASIIERHLTLDRTMDGPDHAASLEPQGFQKMVRDIRQISMALGTGEEKFISRGEILNREVLGKSLVAARCILPGEEITAQMVTVKGPALGLSPQNYTRLLGHVAEREIEEDEPFLERDLGVKISLDVNQLLPMEYGFTVRFRDFTEMLAYQPRMLEFHFTDQDLDEEYPGGEYGADSAQPLKLVVHAPEFWERTLVDLCATEERQRIASRNLLQKTINLTRKMAVHFSGKPKVVIHPGAMSLDHPIKDHAALYENLRRSVQELEYEGVELLLENLPPHPWYFGGQWLTNAFMDAYEIRDFLVSMGLKFCYDSSHHKLYTNWAAEFVPTQGRSEHSVDFYEQLSVLLPYIGHLHLSDGAGLDGEGLQIGEGAIDWVHFFRVLGDYRGTMIPEIWRGHQRQGEGFLIAIRRLSQAYFESREETAGSAEGRL
jgi:sialic acid synthase SpsE/sugar phosphate isomerase/epimerase